MFELTIETKNEAFNDTSEVSRLLREVADQIEKGHTIKIIRDVNGNTVGKYFLI